MGEIKPQIIIFLWFSFAHTERESVRKGHRLFCKTSLGFRGRPPAYRIWPIKPPGWRGFLPLDVPEIIRDVTEIQHQRMGSKDGLNHHIPRRNADGRQFSLATPVSCSFISTSCLFFCLFAFFFSSYFFFFVREGDPFMENIKPMEMPNTGKPEEGKDANLHFSHGLKMTPSLA